MFGVENLQPIKPELLVSASLRSDQTPGAGDALRGLLQTWHARLADLGCHARQGSVHGQCGDHPLARVHDRHRHSHDAIKVLLVVCAVTAGADLLELSLEIADAGYGARR